MGKSLLCSLQYIEIGKLEMRCRTKIDGLVKVLLIDVGNLVR